MCVASVFFTCQRYLNSVTARGQSTLDATFAANNMRRLELLEPLRGMHGLPHALSESIGCVLHLFNDKTPLSERASFMRSNQQHAVKVAIRWDPKGPIGSIGKLFLDVCPAYDKVTFPTFKAAVRAIAEADVFNELASPMANSAIFLWMPWYGRGGRHR